MTERDGGLSPPRAIADRARARHDDVVDRARPRDDAGLDANDGWACRSFIRSKYPEHMQPQTRLSAVTHAARAERGQRAKSGWRSTSRIGGATSSIVIVACTPHSPREQKLTGATSRSRRGQKRGSSASTEQKEGKERACAVKTQTLTRSDDFDCGPLLSPLPPPRYALRASATLGAAVGKCAGPLAAVLQHGIS